MPIDIVQKKCCGCRACSEICPVKAIVLRPDENGFEYPIVNNDICINCEKCRTVCPQLQTLKSNYPRKSGYAYSINNDLKESGSSGGLFGTVAEWVIENGGVVFGAAFDKNLKLRTTYAAEKYQLQPLYKSKYLLCDTDGKFGAIEKELKAGKQVLYTSTPCQVTALKLFLGKEYSNLITIEFVCHGVGSQTMFDESIEFVEKRDGIVIEKFYFRYKHKKASSHYFCYEYNKDGKLGKRKNLYMMFPYYNAYCKELAYREGCYSCKFASEKRNADITIGDFHTILEYDKEVDRFSGVSMLVINTDMGEKIFEALRDRIYFKEMDWGIIKANNRFATEGIIPQGREAFLEAIRKRGFENVAQTLLNPKRDIIKIIYYNLPKKVRDIIVKVKG